MSSVVSVRMNDSEAEILNNAAAFYGCAVSSLLKKLAIENWKMKMIHKRNLKHNKERENDLGRIRID